MNEHLKILLEKKENLINDRLTLLADLKGCDETEARILADGQVTAAEVSELTQARGLKELILNQLPKIEAALRQLDEEIRIELDECRRRFNRAVSTAAAAKVGEVVAVLSPFFDGNLEPINKLLANKDIPAISRILSAKIESAFSADPGLDFYATHARSFIERAARAVAALKLAIE